MAHRFIPFLLGIVLISIAGFGFLRVQAVVNDTGYGYSGSLCNGIEPSGSGVIFTTNTRMGVRDRIWRYVANTTRSTNTDLGASCKWTCAPGFVKSINTCKVNRLRPPIPRNLNSTTGTNTGYMYTGSNNDGYSYTGGNTSQGYGYTGSNNDGYSMYSWNEGQYSSCMGSCTSARRSRVVNCKRNDGRIVPDAFCSGIKPVQSVSCTLASCPTAVNGQCGAANGNTFSTRPTAGLCVNETARVVSGNGPWNWRCFGRNGGERVSCSAMRNINAPSGTTAGNSNSNTYQSNNSNTGISCGGTDPIGLGVIRSSSTVGGVQNTIWTYTPNTTNSTSTNLGAACTWTCAPNYIKNTAGNGCMRLTNISNPVTVWTDSSLSGTKTEYNYGETLYGYVVGGNPNNTWACLESPNAPNSCSTTAGFRRLTAPVNGVADGWQKNNATERIELRTGLLISTGFPSGTYRGYARTGQNGTNTTVAEFRLLTGNGSSTTNQGGSTPNGNGGSTTTSQGGETQVTCRGTLPANTIPTYYNSNPTVAGPSAPSASNEVWEYNRNSCGWTCQSGYYPNQGLTACTTTYTCIGDPSAGAPITTNGATWYPNGGVARPCNLTVRTSTNYGISLRPGQIFIAPEYYYFSGLTHNWIAQYSADDWIKFYKSEQDFREQNLGLSRAFMTRYGYGSIAFPITSPAIQSQWDSFQAEYKANYQGTWLEYPIYVM